MIIGISGLAGTGKDTVADMLVRNHGFVKVSLADPLKRIARDVFAFTDDQLWGPSEARNALDKRYPRKHGPWLSVLASPLGKCGCCGAVEGAPKLIDIESGYVYERHNIPPCFLTPRYALQTLGTEWGRNCYDNIWVEYAVRVAKAIEEEPRVRYTAMKGLLRPTGLTADAVVEGSFYNGVAIPDVRFKNEIAGLKRAGARLIRITRTGYETPRWNHPSETEQMGVSDQEFDAVIRNSGDLEDLAVTLAETLKTLV